MRGGLPAPRECGRTAGLVATGDLRVCATSQGYRARVQSKRELLAVLAKMVEEFGEDERHDCDWVT